MPPPLSHPLLDQLEKTLRRPLSHFLLLLAFALAFYGYSLSFGFVYDDAVLLRSNPWHWLHTPWANPIYYRPLQAVLFDPHLVSRSALLLHFQNVVVGTLVIFLFGRLLGSLGFGTYLTLLIELAGVVLPSSLMLFAWISQRTEWPVDILGLLLALWTTTSRPRAPVYLVVFLLFSVLALLAKESGITLLLLAPALLVVSRRAYAQAIGAVLIGAVLFAGFWALRAHVVGQNSSSWLGLFDLMVVGGFGLLEALLYLLVPVCFTASYLYLGLGATFGAMALLGLGWMWRQDRRRAATLLWVAASFAIGAAGCPEPRNLVVPGLVTAALACDATARVMEFDWGWGRKAALALLLIVNLCAFASTSVLSSYALQDWVETINSKLERLEPGRTRRGNLHEIDVNTRVRVDLRARIMKLLGS